MVDFYLSVVIITVVKYPEKVKIEYFPMLYIPVSRTDHRAAHVSYRFYVTAAISLCLLCVQFMSGNRRANWIFCLLGASCMICAIAVALLVSSNFAILSRR